MLDVQGDRTKESLNAFYNKFSEQQLKKVQSKSMDMRQARNDSGCKVKNMF